MEAGPQQGWNSFGFVYFFMIKAGGGAKLNRLCVLERGEEGRREGGRGKWGGGSAHTEHAFPGVNVNTEEDILEEALAHQKTPAWNSGQQTCTW